MTGHYLRKWFGSIIVRVGVRNMLVLLLLLLLMMWYRLLAWHYFCNYIGATWLVLSLFFALAIWKFALIFWTFALISWTFSLISWAFTLMPWAFGHSWLFLVVTFGQARSISFPLRLRRLTLDLGSLGRRYFRLRLIIKNIVLQIEPRCEVHNKIAMLHLTFMYLFNKFLLALGLEQILIFEVHEIFYHDIVKCGSEV